MAKERLAKKYAKKTNKNTEKIALPLKKSMLVNSAVVTVRNPTKGTEQLCRQLRKILSPDCLNKLEINPKMQDLADVAHQLLVKQIIYISEKEIKIACLPSGPTYNFEIFEYENTHKNFPSNLYNSIPFITFNGKSELRPLFERFGQTSKDTNRVLHFHFKNDVIYMRHFLKTVEDTEENFKVHLREIGPKITLKYIQTVKDVFPELNLKFKYRNRFVKEEIEEEDSIED